MRLSFKLQNIKNIYYVKTDFNPNIDSNCSEFFHILFLQCL